MRKLLPLLLLFVAACNPMSTACGGQDIFSNKTPEQINAIAAACTRSTELANAARLSLVDRIAREADQMGMTPAQYLETAPAQYTVRSYYWERFGGVIVGIPLIILTIWVALMLLRYISRSPTKMEKRKFLWLFERTVVTDWHVKAIEGWTVTFIMGMAGAYIFAIWFGMMS